MAGYTIEQFPDEPILLVSFLEDWNTERDTDTALAAVMQALDAASSPVFYTVDVTIEPRFNLDDLMFVTRRVLRGQNAVLLHPNMRECLIVTRNSVIQQATRVLPRSARASAFDTLDEALTYARERSIGRIPG